MKRNGILLMLLILIFIGSACKENKKEFISTRDTFVIQTIESRYELNSGKKMPQGEAKKILFDLRSSVHRHTTYKKWGILENVELAKMWTESRFDRFAIGKYDKLPIGKRSEGIEQIRHDIAELILQRKVGPKELFTDIQLNIDLGVRHLLSSKTLQAYNAGSHGAKKGYGAHYSRTVKATFQGLPWIVINKKEKCNEKVFFGLFDVVGFHAAKSERHGRSGQGHQHSYSEKGR